MYRNRVNRPSPEGQKWKGGTMVRMVRTDFPTLNDVLAMRQERDGLLAAKAAEGLTWDERRRLQQVEARLRRFEPRYMEGGEC